ncbi:MAG: pentapeptide repeat-containing protein [Candidatus Kapabacteria bacterium]|nr:pentapeptide repeat-containing protein [Candidatus Kapabacteria bacterium]
MKESIKKYRWAIILGLIFIILIVWFIPVQYVNCCFKDIQGNAKLVAIKDIRGDFIQIVAGILAVIALYLTLLRTEALDEQNIINKENNDNNLLLQQYSKASELLANGNNESARLSGIYLFEKILNNSKEYHKQIIELLCAYVREKRAFNIKEYDNLIKNSDENYEFRYKEFDNLHAVFNNTIEKDIQAILSVICRRINDFNDKFLIDLSNSNLYNANFEDGKLNNADFSGSYLVNAYFSGSFLINSKFILSVFHHNMFNETHLNNSRFDLYNGIYRRPLSKIKFNDSELQNLTIENNYISFCEFSNSELQNSNFRGSSFASCILENTNFEGCILKYTKFSGNNLENANMTKIKLHLDDNPWNFSSNNNSADIIEFIEQLKQNNKLKGIKLDTLIMEIINEDYPELFDEIMS